MTSKTIHKYRTFCLTENTLVYSWGETPPITCPNNDTHTIDTNSISIVDSVSSKKINISQDNGLTGGNFRAETIKAVIKPNTTEIFDFSWPFDMSVHTVHFVTNAQHIGDKFSCIIAPNTIIGVITNNVNVGDTTFHVSPTVLQYANMGYIISLFDGANKSIVGYVISKDLVNSTITCHDPSTNVFSASSPTYVMLEIRNIYEFEIGDPNKYDIGQSLIQSGLIPANTIVRLEYKNNSKTDAKSFIFYFEYFY